MKQSRAADAFSAPFAHGKKYTDTWNSGQQVVSTDKAEGLPHKSV